MSKLFLFGVGGTGSRVIKSLVFLLASGIKLKECDEIIPIIVDPHQSNKDLIRTTQLLRLYEDIRSHLDKNNEKFFSTKLSRLSSLRADDRLNNSYTFDLEGVSGTKFKHFIDYDILDESNKALVDLLYSKENLNGMMDIGFVGNPHIGSVVLNQFKYSQEFQTFANNFEKGDRIFIISSIFGGTGASGFPIILKNIRSASKNNHLNSTEFLENAPIGALTVMPYFNIDHNEESQIQKSEWIQKTKSALSYYEKNVTGNNTVNVMYYLGDTMTKSYENDPGERGQKNDAHLIEFIGALSVIEFANTPANYLECKNGKAIKPYAREYGVKENLPSINLTHLGSHTENLVSGNMIQFTLFCKFLLKDFNPKEIGQPYQIGDNLKLDSTFYDTIFYRDYIKSFINYYNNWLSENKRNNRSFNPFNMESDYAETINGVEAKSRGFLNRSRFDLNDIIKELNRASEGSSYESKEIKLISLFYDAMNNIISDNYNRF